MRDLEVKGPVRLGAPSHPLSPSSLSSSLTALKDVGWGLGGRGGGEKSVKIRDFAFRQNWAQ